MISEITEKELSSSGGKSFQVLIENEPFTYNRERVYVKIVVLNNKSFVKFGYFKKENRDVEFVEVEEIEQLIKLKLSNSNLAGIDFSSVIRLFGDARVESNSTLRIINYSRSLFTTLAHSIYKEGVSSSLSAGDMELSLKDVNRLYDYFENRFVTSYLVLMQSKILGYLRRQSSDILRTYLSFKNFIPVMYSGSCIVNPFLESYKMKRIFMQTDLFTKCKEGVFRISEDNTLYMITNKEICESLGISKYLRFYTPQLTMYLLGLLNPDRFPSTKNMTFIDENGNPIPRGVPVDGARQVTSLYSMCTSYHRNICPRSKMDEYVGYLSEGRL